MPNTSKKTLVFIPSEILGAGDYNLGLKLMDNFLASLPEMESLWKIIFINGGVKLTAREGDALNALIALEKSGIEILSCNTCLDYYGLQGKQKVGKPTNMMDFISTIELADKVIRV